MRQATALPVAALVALAVVLFVIAALYASGTIQFLVSTSGPHFKHALLFAGLGVLSLVGASFARARTAI